MRTRKLEWLALAAGLTVSACGDGDALPKTPQAGPTGASGDATTPPPAPGATPSTPGAPAASGARFLAATRVFTPNGGEVFSYFQVLDSIEAGSELDRKKALEVAGSAKLFALSDGSWIAVGEGEAPVLSRYSVAADGALRKQQSISLQPSGVTSFFGNVLYEAAPDAVYYPDVNGHQLVVIDPIAMAVRGTIPLPETERAGYTAYYSERFVGRDGKLLFSVGWFDWEHDAILPATGLVVIDTRTHAVARVDVDARCGGIDTPITVASGDTYFVSNTMAAAAFQLGRHPQSPCALRVRAGDDAFDPGYVQDLRTLVGGAVAGDPIPAGGDALFLRVLDASLAATDATTTSVDLANLPAWRWVRWDLGANQAAPLASLPPAPANTEWFQVGARVFGSEATADYARTTLIELTAPGGPRPALVSPGYLHGLAALH